MMLTTSARKTSLCPSSRTVTIFDHITRLPFPNFGCDTDYLERMLTPFSRPSFCWCVLVEIGYRFHGHKNLIFKCVLFDFIRFLSNLIVFIVHIDIKSSNTKINSTRIFQCEEIWRICWSINQTYLLMRQWYMVEGTYNNLLGRIVYHKRGIRFAMTSFENDDTPISLRRQNQAHKMKKVWKSTRRNNFENASIQSK